jgi:hypothetical protein
MDRSGAGTWALLIRVKVEVGVVQALTGMPVDVRMI